MNRFCRIVIALLLLTGTVDAAGLQPAGDAPGTLPVVVRVDGHHGYGRIIYELPAPMRYDLSAEPGEVKLEVQGVPTLPIPKLLPRNVRAIHASGSAIELDLVEGARPRATQVGERIIVDLLDPVRPQPAHPTRRRTSRNPPPPATATRLPSAASPSPTKAAPARKAVPASAVSPAPLLPPPPAIPASKPALATELPPALPPAQPVPRAPRDLAEQQSLAPSSPAPAEPSAAADAGPISVAVAPLPSGEPGAVLPFPSKVGAAAFRRGDQAVLVFDTRQPLDLGEVANDPVLRAAKVELLPAATLVTFPLATDTPLHMERAPEGWIVRLGGSANPPLPEIRQTDGEVAFGLADPSQVVVVPDPESRAPLLVGTVRPSSGPGAAMPVSRRTPSFRILTTWLGLAVDALSDRVQLSTRADGFALRVPSPLLTSEVGASPALAHAAALTRIFDFPDLPMAALQRRMEASVDAAAAAPPRARLPARLAAAQAMIALGLGAEAEGLLATARAENPGEEQDGRIAALQALAALLDGRSDRAGAVDDPGLGASDEITLWRAVAAASASEHSPAAATAFAATLPLVIAYPEPLRQRLLPLAAETLALGGQEKAADALFAQFPSEPTLSLARALCLEAEGKTDKALAAYDQLATDHDRLVRVRAGTRAVELRHRSGTLDAAATADALDRFLVVWRGDQRELSLRLRIAELRTQDGQFRPALELLRDTQTLFPADRERIKTRIGQVLQALLTGDRASALKPLELITLAGDFADFVPDGAAGDRLATLLAGRLVALDLPDQAAPVLERLMHAAPPGAPRARFGLQLAAMRLESGDAATALAALQASDSPNLSTTLAGERGLMLARAQARAGDLPGATSTLSALGTASADELRASLLESAKDWPGALAALRDLAAKRVATAGPLPPDQQQIVLREASAALQAGDQGTLLALRQTAGPRMGDGHRADLFRLLTDSPVRSPADLPRAARDVALAREMSGNLQGLSTP